PIFSDGEEGITVIDQLADKVENVDNWSERISLYEAMKVVPDKELDIVKLRYFEGKTQIEISELVGISQAQVSRLEKSAIAKLKCCLAD
ncbi:MAG: sigma-70 family RNA polymerase sigma factor, partial [Clostridia bacterium]